MHCACMQPATLTARALSLSLLFRAVVVVSVRLKRRLHAGFCVDEIGTEDVADKPALLALEPELLALTRLVCYKPALH